MDNSHLKNPLNKSLNDWGTEKTQDRVQLLGKSLPCMVTEVIPPYFVTVAFQVNGGNQVLNPVTIPVVSPEYIRYPIQVGCKGYAVPASVRLGGLTGLGAGIPRLRDTPSNLGALAFLPLTSSNLSAPDDADAICLYGVGSKGVVMRDGNKTVTFTLTSTGIAIDLGGGTLTVTNGDVVDDGISLKTHVHSGVTTGSGDTGAPV